MGGVPLTVLLPVYNGEPYLNKAIESVLSQSYGNFEFLVLDDGSRDRTPAILQHYAAQDGRVRVLHHENRGVGYTLNRGLSEARGDLIALIGADDVALPGRLEKQVSFLSHNADHVLVGGYLRIIDPEDKLIGMRRYPTSDRELRERILLYNPIGDPTVMYRRADALAAGGYTTRVRTCEDYDLLLRLAKRGKIANIPEPLTAYRLHPESLKSQRTLRQLKDTLAIRRIAAKEYGYSPTLGTRLVSAAQWFLTRLPPAVSYWLFVKLFVKPERQTA
jgi:glycosyltransferase involved in cell wall biosynthesis